jgi:hypothetical protein
MARFQAKGLVHIGSCSLSGGRQATLVSFRAHRWALAKANNRKNDRRQRLEHQLLASYAAKENEELLG